MYIEDLKNFIPNNSNSLVKKNNLTKNLSEEEIIENTRILIKNLFIQPRFFEFCKDFIDEKIKNESKQEKKERIIESCKHFKIFYNIIKQKLNEELLEGINKVRNNKDNFLQDSAETLSKNTDIIKNTKLYVKTKSKKNIKIEKYHQEYEFLSSIILDIEKENRGINNFSFNDKREILLYLREEYKRLKCDNYITTDKLNQKGGWESIINGSVSLISWGLAFFGYPNDQNNQEAPVSVPVLGNQVLEAPRNESDAEKKFLDEIVKEVNQMVLSDIRQEMVDPDDLYLSEYFNYNKHFFYFWAGVVILILILNFLWIQYVAISNRKKTNKFITEGQNITEEQKNDLRKDIEDYINEMQK